MVYPSRQGLSDPKPEKGWRRKSGTAETLTSHAVKRFGDIVRYVRIQLHFISIRTPWLPPFVLCVYANFMSADRTNEKRGRRSSQAARSNIYRRRISPLCTISRISHTAWEIRVSAAPDFRLHPSSDFGYLYFVNWDEPNVSAQTHQKILFHKPISAIQTVSHSIKFFAQLSFKKARIPLP